jgi:hypothetical protein
LHQTNSREKAQKAQKKKKKISREAAKLRQDKPQMNPPPLRYGATGC